MNTISNKQILTTHKNEIIPERSFKKNSIQIDEHNKIKEIKETIKLGEYSIDMDKLSSILSNNI